MTLPHNGTETSIAAAESVKDAKTLREQVFAAIRDAGPNGMTDYELQQALGISGNTERPRRWELSHRERCIRDSGKTRRTPTGRQSVVWVLGSDGAPAPPTLRKVTREEVVAYLIEISVLEFHSILDEVAEDENDDWNW